MKHALKDYGGNTSYDKVWDTLQQKYQCCGVGQLGKDSAPGYLDWMNSTWYNKANVGEVPISCCRNQTDPTCGTIQMNQPNTTTTEIQNAIYNNGCLHEFYIWFRANIEIAVGINIGGFVLQVMIIVSAFSLRKYIITFNL